MATTFTQLPVGAGGFLRGMDVVSDGTVVVNADTYGAYIYNYVSGLWEQLVTTTRMPASAFTNLVTDGTGGVYAIRIAPSNSSRIYMTYLNKVYRSDDKGASFTLTGFSALALSPNYALSQYGPRMAVDPANPDVCYLSTDSAGVWVTTNAGSSWSKVSTIANNNGSGLGVIAFDASSGTTGGNTNTIYASASGTGIYRSTNAGSSWTLMTSTPTNVYRIKVHTDGIAYIVTSAGSLQKLSGTTFTDITDVGASGQVDNVLLDPSNAAHITIIYSAGYTDDSTNRGSTWSGTNFTKSRLTNDIPYLGTIFQSITGGSESSFFFGIGEIWYNPGDSNKIWMTGGQSVFTTPSILTSGNQVWTDKGRGIEQLVANQILSVPGGDPLLISWDVGIIKKVSASLSSYADAERWDTARGINRASAADYAKSDPTFIAAILNQVAESSGYSTDRGITWQAFASAPPFFANGNIGGSIAVSTPSNMVWAPNQNGDLYNTKNGGTTWSKIAISGVPASPSETGWGFNSTFKQFIVCADPVNANTFYAYNYGPAAAGSAKGVYKSTDSGDTWSHVYTTWLSNIPSAGDNAFNAKLRCLPGVAGTLFFTGGQQGNNGDAVPHTQSFWKSTDAGTTWNAIANVLEVYDFGFGAPMSGSSNYTLYIYGWVSGVGGIWRSTDLGSTWTQLSGLFPGGWIDTFCAISGDMNTAGIVYCGFTGSGYVYGFDTVSSIVRFPNSLQFRMHS